MFPRYLMMLLSLLLSVLAYGSPVSSSPMYDWTDPVDTSDLFTLKEDVFERLDIDTSASSDTNITPTITHDIADNVKVHDTTWSQRMLPFLILAILILSILLILTRRYINRLRKSVADQTQKLNKLNETLEQNVRERTRSLNALSERYEFAIQGTQDGLWDWDLITNSVYFSAQWKSMIGYEEDELDNNYWSWESRIHPQDQEKALADIQYCISGQRSKIENIHRLRHKNGDWIWVLNRAKVFYDAKGDPIRMAGFHSDITKHKKAEDEIKFKEQIIFQQSKMAAMGEMIENISHQWRQPLNIIGLSTTQIETAMMFGSLEEKDFSDDIRVIQEQIAYMSQTINDFRKFFKYERKKERFDVADALQETLNLINAKIKNRHIKVDTRLQSVYTNGYRSEFIQAIINILNNAIYQLERAKGLEARLLFIHMSIESQESVTLTITDNGGGIPDEAIDKLFVPYFTTKESDVGTGIGLYLTHEIIVNHFSGEIRAENAHFVHDDVTYQGASFILSLPLDENDR
jgi:PAS domain S-box-containing protein